MQLNPFFILSLFHRYFIVILLILLQSEIKLSFGEKMSHKLATATFIKKNFLQYVTRKIAGA